MKQRDIDTTSMPKNPSVVTTDLAQTVYDLSLARDLNAIMQVVKTSVRTHVDADGVTFILRENDSCYYADETAISPLWKGRRFPLSQCISGWVMTHKESVAIDDIYADDRILHDAYRPTFVKSLYMVPIRSADPIGAIGAYWSTEHRPSPEEENYIRAIANTAAVAVENVQVNKQLSERISELSNERERLEGILEATRDKVLERTADGVPLSMFGTITDISQRKQTEQRLRLLEFSVENTSVSVFQITPEGYFIYANKRARDMLGLSKDTLCDTNVADVDPNFPREARKKHWQTLKEKGSLTFDTQHRSVTGQSIQVEVTNHYFRYGSREYEFAFAVDVSQRKRVEKALRDSQREMARAQSITQTGSWRFELNTGLASASDETRLIYGLTDHTLSIKQAQTIPLPQYRQQLDAALRHLIDHGTPYDVEFEIRRPSDNELRHIHSVAEYDVKQNAVFGIIRDITEQKQIQKTLQENEAMLQAALDNSHAGIAIANAPDGRLRYVNDAALRILGNAATMQNQSPPEYIDKWRAFHCDGTPYQYSEFPLVRSILHGETCSEEFVVRRNNDEQRIVWANTAPIYGKPTGGQTHRKKTEKSAKDVTAGIIVFLDITETKRLNERLKQAEKMESIGTLAGGIAHDFNNILGAIIGYADLSLGEVQPESQLATNLQHILEGGDRAKHLVRQILNFSRSGNDEKTPQHLQPILTEAIALLRASLPSSIHIHSTLKRNTAPVLADATQIHEIIMNLGTNAAHAMTNEKGVLDISYEETICHHDVTGRAGTLPPGRYSLITVRDNGCGMDAKTLERIFEPFFTTKAQGEGTGMGMAVLFGIVQRHNGTITIDSDPGNGTCVRVYLPASREERSTRISDQPTPMERGTERILFVDDEPAMGKMSGELLTGLGYTVTVFDHPQRALDAFKETPSSFDLVITDQTMPAISGMELAREIRNINPDIPIILCTGYSKLIDEEHARDEGIDGFLTKPFRLRLIAHKIRDVLNHRTRQ